MFANPSFPLVLSSSLGPLSWLPSTCCDVVQGSRAARAAGWLFQPQLPRDTHRSVMTLDCGSPHVSPGQWGQTPESCCSEPTASSSASQPLTEDMATGGRGSATSAPRPQEGVGQDLIHLGTGAEWLCGSGRLGRRRNWRLQGRPPSTRRARSSCPLPLPASAAIPLRSLLTLARLVGIQPHGPQATDRLLMPACICPCLQSPLDLQVAHSACPNRGLLLHLLPSHLGEQPQDPSGSQRTILCGSLFPPASTSGIALPLSFSLCATSLGTFPHVHVSLTHPLICHVHQIPSDPHRVLPHVPPSDHRCWFIIHVGEISNPCAQGNKQIG